MLQTTRASLAHGLSIALILLLVLAAASALWTLAATTDFGESDFMIYWAAAYLVNNGESPYDLDLIRAVQQSQPHTRPEVTTIAWNPPFMFLFLMPFAWLPFPVAKFAWLISSILLVLTAALMLANVYLITAPSKIRLAFLALAVAFPAVVTGLYMGQVTFLVFWGLVASLFLMKRDRWFWAGAALLLTTIKPHMVILPVLYILIYMTLHRKVKGWMGAITVGTIGLVVLLALSPDLIFNPIGETSVAAGRWATSTIGGLLSYLGVTEVARYLIVLLLPLPFLMAKHSEKFSLEFSVAVLTLITVPTTFYGWSYDQTILLIPIAQLFAWLAHSKYRLAIAALIAGAIGLNYFQRVLPFNEVFYLWVPLVWGLIFVTAWRTGAALRESSGQPAARNSHP